VPWQAKSTIVRHWVFAMEEAFFQGEVFFLLTCPLMGDPFMTPLSIQVMQGLLYLWMVCGLLSVIFGSFWPLGKQKSSI
jgi:hypothetical protein